MKRTRPLTRNLMDGAATEHPYRRRRFLAAGASVGAALLAGCTGESGAGDSDGNGSTSTSAGGTDGTSETSSAGGTNSVSGTFRLLISDQPVAIDDFDELNVSFDRAQIFREEGTDDEEDETETQSPTITETTTATPTETATATPTVTATETATETETAGGEPDHDEQRGFSTVDLDGATVDLTQVVGEKAIGVFDGELPEGRYTKIELYAAGVEGIVDGKLVDVTIPSGKLQIVKPFEVEAGEAVTFVFDINVVKKGKTGEYNLLPVISESGVAGQDVEAEEIGNEAADSERTEEEGTEKEEGTEGEEGTEKKDEKEGEGDGSPDDAGGNP